MYRRIQDCMLSSSHGNDTGFEQESALIGVNHLLRCDQPPLVSTVRGP